MLYISNCFSFSPTHAAAVTTYEIVKGLAKKGHEVTVFVPSVEGGKRAGDFAFKSGELRNVKIVTSVPASLSLTQEGLLSYGLLCSVFFAPLFAKALKNKMNYDAIISMFHPTHFATFCAYLISRILKLPFLVKVHDLLLDADDPNFWRRAYKEAVFKLYLGSLKNGGFILVQSSEWMHLLRKVYRVSKKRIVLFPNGVDAVKFNSNVECSNLRVALGLENKKIVLFAGAILRIRGLDCLIKAMPQVLREEPDARLLIIGEGSERPKLFELAKRLGVDKFILFIDEAAHDLMPSYICLAEVTIGPLTALPTTIGTFPIKVLEYMACGKPVVACHNGASKDLIINGCNGLLIGSGKVEELSAAIIRLFKDAELAKNLGMNARKHIESFYDWNILIDRLDQILTCSALAST